MTPKQMHLADDQLEEILIGCASPETIAHLHDCTDCAGQLAEFRSSVADFNYASSAWSQAKSNALTRDLHRHRPAFRITAGAAWSCASVVVLAGAAALGLGLRQHSEQITASNAQQRWTQADADASQAVSQREIASDDAMLRQIDSALDTAEPSPEELYGIADTAAATRQNSLPQVKD